MEGRVGDEGRRVGDGRKSLRWKGEESEVEGRVWKSQRLKEDSEMEGRV